MTKEKFPLKLTPDEENKKATECVDFLHSLIGEYTIDTVSKATNISKKEFHAINKHEGTPYGKHNGSAIDTVPEYADYFLEKYGIDKVMDINCHKEEIENKARAINLEAKINKDKNKNTL